MGAEDYRRLWTISADRLVRDVAWHHNIGDSGGTLDYRTMGGS